MSADLGPLFIAPPPRRRPDLAAKKSKRELFEEFHAANPHVYAELVRLAREAKSKGASRIGIRMLWEVLRWNWRFQTVRPESAPKLNDWFPPYFARLIQEREPDLAGFFETRDRTEGEPL